MRISADHRSLTRRVPVTEYRRAADEFVEVAEGTGIFDSVIVCGSLVKNDVVTGWSDLDLICIARDSTGKIRAIDTAAEICRNLISRYGIGIGLDLAWRDEFDRTSRIGGRPLAMTYEVAQYGEFYINRTPFSTALTLPEAQSALMRERTPLALAEIHNWRRTLMEPIPLKARAQAALTVKTLLKLLKISVAPYEGNSFTHAEDITRLDVSITPSLREAFKIAVDTRDAWPSTHRFTHIAQNLTSILGNLDTLQLLEVMNA